jgi:hypothetical protein
MDEIKRLVGAWRDGDVTACVAIADWYVDRDDPDGEELAQLAQWITCSSDWAVVDVSVEVFGLILVKKGWK